MARSVADEFLEILVLVGVKRIYGIVGDSLNGLTDALRRQGKIDWVHVRHEEIAAFAASAEGIRLEDAGEVDDGIAATFADRGPVLINAVVNRTELAMPPSITAEMAAGFSLYMVKAILNGRADEIIDLAKTNLWR